MNLGFVLEQRVAHLLHDGHLIIGSLESNLAGDAKFFRCPPSVFGNASELLPRLPQLFRSAAIAFRPRAVSLIGLPELLLHRSRVLGSLPLSFAHLSGQLGALPDLLGDVPLLLPWFRGSERPINGHWALP